MTPRADTAERGTAFDLLQMNEVENKIRPSVIGQIARWWKERLDAAAVDGEALEPPVWVEVMAEFGCSEEEALRGLCVGEHLYWGDS